MSTKLIEESHTSKATIGRAGLGVRGQNVLTPGQAVHDGDTVFARALANISIRFLGVDTPEVAFALPGEEDPTPIFDPKWEAFLSDPFADWPDSKEILGSGLHTFLLDHTGPGTAADHADHATAAQHKLEQLVKADVAEFAGGDAAAFVLFLRYAKDVIDRYGRLLGYVTVSVDHPAAAPPLSYNELMLRAGMSAPYFIWPNLDPFKKQPNLLDAVPAPEDIPAVAGTGRLKKARNFVARARRDGIGIFEPNPLRLQPFELRFLAGKRAPDRWVIDLSSRAGALLPPTDYHTIDKAENRLYVPAEFVALFEYEGWLRDTAGS
jgi:endonuclease YncB( thermonuclease family)